MVHRQHSQADRLCKTLINTNVVASRYLKREEVSVAVRHSKITELNLNLATWQRKRHTFRARQFLKFSREREREREYTKANLNFLS